MRYTYAVHQIGAPLGSRPGNYIFARETTPGEWQPVYIGETGDLGEQFDNHRAMSCITRAGATHIHIHGNNAGVDGRRQEEGDLIRRWSPPCNG
jgi:hypothetical protein